MKKQRKKFNSIFYCDFETEKGTVAQFRAAGCLQPEFEKYSDGTFITQVIAGGCAFTAFGKCQYFVKRDIRTFLDAIVAQAGENDIMVYFHNLKFDFEFIKWFLLLNGFKNVYQDEFKNDPKTFSYLQVGFMKTLYRAAVSWNGKKISFIDSAKLLAMPLKNISKFLGTEVEKGEYDFNNHVLGSRPKALFEYLKKDCQLLQQGVEKARQLGLKRDTTASSALYSFKQISGLNKKEAFRAVFPILSNNARSYSRYTYTGGLSFCAQDKINKTQKDVYCVDVVSEYPTAMYYKPMPFGEGLFVEGKELEDKFIEGENTYCEIKVEIELTVKKDTVIPFLRLGKQPHLTVARDKYFTSYRGILFTNSIDLRSLQTYYNITKLKFIDGFVYKTSQSLFKKHIDYWLKVKSDSKKTNKPLYNVAKVMLNSLYGKFGQNLTGNQYCCSIGENDEFYEEDFKLETDEEGMFSPIASAVCAYGREQILAVAQSVGKENFCYTDTDSVHAIGEIPDYIKERKGSNLGNLEVEYEHHNFKTLKKKTYIHYPPEKPEDIVVKAVGMTDEVKKEITKDNFDFSFISDKIKKAKKVVGGIVIEQTEFSIRVGTRDVYNMSDLE